MSRILLNTKTWLLFALLLGISFSAWAQSDDFNTWTKFKVNHKIDSRFSVSGDLQIQYWKQRVQVPESVHADI